MATTITRDEALGLAKEILPGASSATAFTGSRWSTTVTLEAGPFSVDVSIWDTGAGFTVGSADDLGIRQRNIGTVEDLRRFLEACRDALVKHLTALLEVALGPVRVLPKDEGLDEMRPADFCAQVLQQAHTVMTMAGVLQGYQQAAERRRAKPASS